MKMRFRGFLFVRRIGKSGDFGADIIARGFLFSKIVVQCKNYSHPVGVRAVQEVNAARRYYGASRAAVATNNTFTKQAIELAKKCEVELWQKF
jgi:restriction system protein